MNVQEHQIKVSRYALGLGYLKMVLTTTLKIGVVNCVGSSLTTQWYLLPQLRKYGTVLTP